MVELKKQHPHYSFDMEVLMSIPPGEHGAIVSEVATDMGRCGNAEIIDSVARLVRGGYSVRLGFADSDGPGNRKRIIFVEGNGWPKIAKDCDAYWHRVYGLAANRNEPTP